jgi:hypothetical protein
VEEGVAPVEENSVEVHAAEGRVRAP